MSAWLRLNALDRKLLRDLWHMRGQLVAVALVVMCGLAVFMTMRGMYETLLSSRTDYYREYRFAEVFCHLKRAPEAASDGIAAIPGVSRVQTGISLEVTLDIPGLTEPATGVLVSVPDRGRPALNDLFLVRGRWIEPGARHEVMVSEAFALANHIEPGSTFGAVINGHWQILRAVGIAMSPEYIYVLRPASGLPDNQRYGILWMGREGLAYAYDMVGAFNRLAVTLSSDASQSEVIAAIDRHLSRYGSLGAYGREDQLSNKVITDEIAHNKVHGLIISSIFLAVAAFILNIVLLRLVATQRDQIAVLKAFGYTNLRVGLHYLQMALLAVAAGTALALPLAYSLGHMLVGIYSDFFHFPRFSWHISAGGMSAALGVGAMAGASGAYSAVMRAVGLPPAEAMRPEPPPRYQPTFIERLGFERWLPIASRMILRNLERRPWKAFLSVLGISLAVAMLVAGRFGNDALDYIMDMQFRVTQREDVMIEFSSPRSAAAVHSVAKLPGVRTLEPFRYIPAKFRHGHRQRRTGMIALPHGGDLRAIISIGYRRVPVPDEGIVLSAKLAHSLGVQIGDRVTVEILEGNRRVADVTVIDTVDDLLGAGAYVSLDTANQLLREAGAFSGAFLAVDAAQADDLYHRLKSLPEIRATSVKDAMLSNFRDVIAKSLSVQTLMNVIFACIIAFGVVYNSVRIALSERARELASLRVLGFTKREITVMLLGEQAMLTAFAIPLGFLIGYGICAAVTTIVNSTQETFRLPLTLSTRTFAFAFVTVSIAAAVSGLMIAGRIRRLDLIAVLKTRE